MRTALFAIALSGVFTAFVQAEEDRTLEISRSSYAAISYSPATGKYAYACDYRSRSAAEKAALGKCGADDAVIACWVNFGFCALALGNDKSSWGVGWKYGNGANNRKADEQAIADCKTQTTGVHTAVIVSSDGQYVWDSKDHITIIDKNGNVYRGGELVTPPPQGNSSPAGAAVSPRPKASSSAGDDVLRKALEGKFEDKKN